jgi:hypothetical protein
MMLNQIRLALAAAVLAFAAAAAIDRASAQGLIEYGLMAGFVDIAADIPDEDFETSAGS